MFMCYTEKNVLVKEVGMEVKPWVWKAACDKAEMLVRTLCVNKKEGCLCSHL